MRTYEPEIVTEEEQAAQRRKIEEKERLASAQAEGDAARVHPTTVVRSDHPQVELRFDPRESRLTSKVSRDELVPTVCADPRHILMTSRGGR